MKSYRLIASLLSLAFLTCSRSPTLLVTVENVPTEAQSLQVIATHANLAAIMDIEPYELPQPTQATSTFLLRLPANFSGDIGVSVGAFKSAGGAGCLVASGATTEMMFAGPDATMRVPLAAVTDTDCAGSKVFLTGAAPALAGTVGGETITINGWGFKPGAKVLFGTTAARSVTYVSALQLQAVTPAKAGFGLTPIKVTNTDNSTGTNAKIFRFYSNTPDFTGIPFQPTGDFSNANGFAFAVFDPTTTLDAAVAQPSKDYVRILLTTGTQTSYVDYTIMPSGSKPTGVSAADFNKDGKQDVVVGTQGDNMVRILLNDGKGNLTLSKMLPVGMGPDAILTADLTGDGNVDIVVANRLENSISVLFGDGKGDIKGQTKITGITDPISLSLGDLNLDGQPDIIVGSYSSGSLSIYFNDQGNFEGRFPKASLTVGKTVSGVLAVDVNYDNKPDIVAAATDDNRLVVIINNGLPNIQMYNLPTQGLPRAVQAGDINGDGFLDLIVPCNTTSTVDVFLNIKGTGFDTQVPYTPFPAQCTGPVQAAIYDIDRDGRQDVGVLCQTGIGLLINHSGQ